MASSPIVEVRSKKTLLLVDVQVNMLAAPPDGVPNAPIVSENIQRVLAEARAALPSSNIIHVRNTGDVGDPDFPGTSGWQLAFKTRPGEPIVDKLNNNSFEGTSLGQLIPTDSEVIVVGMQSDYCIRATCSAAVGRGNKVVLIKGTHATYDRSDEELGGSGITPAKDVEKEIEAELDKAGVILGEMKDLSGIFADS